MVWRLRVMIATGLGMILLGAVVMSARAASAEKDAALSDARALIQQGDFRAARRELLNVIKADPNSTEALIAQAIVSLELFDGVAAQASLEKAIALGTPKSSVLHILGHAYWLQGDLDQAETALRDSGIPIANRAYAHRILGRVQMDKGDFAAAQAVFQSAIEQAPKDSRLWTDLARLRFVSADQKGALQTVEFALELDPNNIRALELRGRFMRSQFGLVAALPWFERGLQISPDDIPLLEEYALTLGEAGRNRDMLVQLRRIIALEGSNSKAFFMQAVIAARAGNYELARRILPKAGEAFNELPAAMLLNGIIEFELGNYNRSVDRLQRLLDIQPRNRHVRSLLAQAMVRAGRPFEALDTIQEIAARRDADSYSLMTAARAFEASDQTERSFAALDDAALALKRPSLPLPDPVTLIEAGDDVRRNPDDARVVVPYIRLLLLAGNIGMATREATRLQLANPGVVDAHLLAGDVAMTRNDASKAVAAYRQAQKISFTRPVMLRLVDALDRVGDNKAASTTLAEYLAYNPTDLTALRLAGYRNLDARQWQTAISVLERVRQRIGYNDSILLANLARAHAGAGKIDIAVEYAGIAYRVAPANAMVTKIYADVLRQSGKRPKAARELAAKVIAQSAQRE
jgi:cellulose synthase operon protein C